MNFKFKNKVTFILLLLLQFASLPSAFADTPTQRIPVQGQADCSDGHQSTRCGFRDNSDWFPDNVGDGEGGSNDKIGKSSSGSNTPPTSTDKNRQPECLRESLFMAEKLAAIATAQKPIGTYVPLVITDPDYSGYANSAWGKYEITTIFHESSKAQYGIRWKITMHYMYNPVTNQVHQAKLKNSFEDGCTGKEIKL